MNYRLTAAEISLVYERTHDNLGGAGAPAPVVSCTASGQNCYGHHVWYLSAQYRLGADAVKLAYGRAGALAGATGDSGAAQVSIGYDHPLGERTRIFAQYTRLANAQDVAYGLSTNTVTSGATAAAGDGATLSGVSIGLRQVF